jgi:hypothetical protein
MLSQYCQTLCIARRYPILAGLCASEPSPNPARWADPTTQHPCSRMAITMAFTAKKTEHTGAKHRRGTYWGPKRDAKLESHRLRRRQGKCLLRHEEQLPEQSKVDKLRTALQASAGGWKALIDAEELIKKKDLYKPIGLYASCANMGSFRRRKSTCSAGAVGVGDTNKRCAVRVCHLLP